MFFCHRCVRKQISRGIGDFLIQSNARAFLQTGADNEHFACGTVSKPFIGPVLETLASFHIPGIYAQAGTMLSLQLGK